MNGMWAVVALLILGAASPCWCMNNTTASNVSTAADNRTSLFIGALFNLDVQPDWGVLPMAQQAVREVNSNAHILPGYKLELVTNSTRGHLGFGQHVFQEYLNTGPRKIMLLGPADDTMAKPIASYAALPHVRLMQFSYGTSDLELANRRDLYPYFFRTAPSLASYDSPRIAMLKYYNWDEVGIIYGDSLLYMQVANQFKSRLKSNGIKVLAEVRLQNNDPTRAVRTMKNRDVHVILGMFGFGVSARRMFCSAYRNGMHGPHYVWILLGGSNLGWWIPRSTDRLECDATEMKCQIQNHFTFTGAGNSPRSQVIAHAQKNVSTILTDYFTRVDSNTSTANRSDHALFVHDAVWSIAMVLENSRAEMERWNRTLDGLSYGDLEALAIFYNETLKLDFDSPNLKNVKYFANGNRNFDVRVRQLFFKNGRMGITSAGSFDNGLFTPSKTIRWFAGVPYRKTEESFTYRSIDGALFAVLVTFASFGLLYGLICCLSVAIHMKRKRELRHSAGVISLLIILGCLLNYITAILYGFDYTRVAPATVTNLCRARAWTFSLGFSLSVGGLVAKLWISYTVLSKRTLMSKKRRLMWMLLLVFLLVTFDIVFLICWEVTDPLYRKLKIVKSQPQYKCFEPISAAAFRADHTVVETCSCSDVALWLSVLLVFKSLVLFFGAFLAWQTRKVYIPSLTHTRRCAVCMFVAFFFCVVGVVAAFSAELYPSTFYGFVGFFIIIVTTFVLGYLFNYLVVQLFCMRKPGHVACQCCVPWCDWLSLSCAKRCRCCACCERCCASCRAWLLSCLLGCCAAPKDPTGSQPDSKLDYVIIGQPFDKDAQITYLQNTIKERDDELEKLRQKRNAVASEATQTWGSSDEEEDSDDDGGDGNEEGGEENRDGATKGAVGIGGANSKTRKKFRKAARKVKIYHQKLDFSHIQSKVDSNLKPEQQSPRDSISKSSGGDMSRLYGRRGSVAVKEELDGEIKALKNVLVEKENEIQRLKAEIAAAAGATKEGRRSSVRPKPHTRQSVRISMQGSGGGSTVKEAKQTRGSLASGPSFSETPPRPTVVVIDETTTGRAEPERTNADVLEVSLPKATTITVEGRRAESGEEEDKRLARRTDGVLSESMATTPKPEREKTGDAVTRNNLSLPYRGAEDSVTGPLSSDTGEERSANMASGSDNNGEAVNDDKILPAGFWLFGRPEERDGPKVGTNEDSVTQDTPAEGGLHEKVNLQSGAATAEEASDNGRHDAGGGEGRARAQQQAGVDAQQPRDHETNDRLPGESCDEDAARREDSVTNTLAPPGESGESLQESVKTDDEGKRREEKLTGQNIQAISPVAQDRVSTNETSSQKKDAEAGKDGPDTRNADYSDDEFGVIDDSFDVKNSKPPNDRAGEIRSSGYGSGSDSSGKNTYAAFVGSKDDDLRENVGFGESSNDSLNNLKTKKNPGAKKVVKTRATKRWSKLRWAAKAKVDTGGAGPKPYRTSVKSYKRKRYSHVRSRLFESTSNKGKQDKDGNTASAEDENRPERRRVLKRPTGLRRKVVGRSSDQAVAKS